MIWVGGVIVDVPLPRAFTLPCATFFVVPFVSHTLSDPQILIPSILFWTSRKFLEQ